MLGEEIHDTFLILEKEKEPIELVLPESTVRDCPICLNVLANAANPDDFQNDKTAFLWKFNQTISALEIRLQKKENGIFVEGDYVQILNNNSLGTYFARGFIIDEKNRKYAGYLIDWHLVLLAYGTGIYRIQIIETNFLGTTDKFTEDYCLSTYTPDRANGTVKIEFINYNILGSIDDKTDYNDYGDGGWYDQKRLCGQFGYDTSDYVDERVEYSNGRQKWVKDEQIVKFTLKLKPITAELHDVIKTEILQADEILITDYNKNNPNKHIQENVNRAGSYEPKYEKFSKLSPVEVQFISAYNNLRKKRC